MKVEKAESKTDVFVKIFLFFFVSLLSFSIGVFVGKKFSDNQYKLAQLEPGGKTEHSSHAASTDASAKTDHGTATADKSEMTDEEISKLAEEFVEDEAPLPVAKKEDSSGHHTAAAAPAHTDTHASAKAETKTVHTEAVATTAPTKAENKKTIERSTASIAPETKHATHETDPLKGVAKSIAEDRLPEQAQSKEVKKDGPAIPTKLPEHVNYDSLGKYTIQVGSYNSETDAKKAAEDYKKKGFAAFYIQAKVKDQSWYRVSIGLFATQKEAIDYKKTLIDKKTVQSAIVQKIVN